MRHFPPINVRLITLQAHDRHRARELAEATHRAFVDLANRSLAEITAPAPSLIFWNDQSKK
jgi:hypothetical protein